MRVSITKYESKLWVWFNTSFQRQPKPAFSWKRSELFICSSSSPQPQVLTPLGFGDEQCSVFFRGRLQLFVSWALFCWWESLHKVIRPTELCFPPQFLDIPSGCPTPYSWILLPNLVALLATTQACSTLFPTLHGHIYLQETHVPYPDKPWVHKAVPIQSPHPTATGHSHFSRRSQEAIFGVLRPWRAQFHFSESSRKVLFTRLAVKKVAHPTAPHWWV